MDIVFGDEDEETPNPIALPHGLTLYGLRIPDFLHAIHPGFGLMASAQVRLPQVSQVEASGDVAM